jgi:hypothetical protein
MPRFQVSDLGAIEQSPVSPACLRSKLSDMLLSSVRARANVEVVNPDTGEYRIVLQGTLDRVDPRRDETH